LVENVACWSFLPAVRSLERRARYLFYCMFFLFVHFFCQRFLDNPRADSYGRTLVPDVSSPLLGVSGPGGGGRKRGNKIFVTIRVNGEFSHFGGF